MTESSITLAFSAEAASSTPLLGVLLRQAREQAAVSLDAVSQQLKLSQRQLTALENDDYSVFSSRVFLRGAALNYSKLFTIDGAMLEAALHRASPEVPLPSITSPYKTSPLRKSHFRLLRWMFFLTIAVVFAVFGASFLKTVVPFSQQALAERLKAVVARPRLPAASPTPNAPARPAGLLAVTSVPATTAEKDVLEPLDAVAAVSSDLNSKPVQRLNRRLELVASAPAWVEIINGDGETLYQETMGSGETQAFETSPTVKLRIGNAPQVQLHYNGKWVDLGQYTRGGIARLELN